MRHLGFIGLDKLAAATQAIRAGPSVMMARLENPVGVNSLLQRERQKMRPPLTDFIATEARFGAQNYDPLGVVLSRGEGVFVWDTQGNRYLDCLSAYSAVNQGHCHPKILAAMCFKMADAFEAATKETDRAKAAIEVANKAAVKLDEVDLSGVFASTAKK